MGCAERRRLQRAFLRAAFFWAYGFTGTSIYIDPDRQLFVVLLTNRVNPTRENMEDREGAASAARRGDASAGAGVERRDAIEVMYIDSYFMYIL